MPSGFHKHGGGAGHSHSGSADHDHGKSKAKGWRGADTDAGAAGRATNDRGWVEGVTQAWNEKTGQTTPDQAAAGYTAAGPTPNYSGDEIRDIADRRKKYEDRIAAALKALESGALELPHTLYNIAKQHWEGHDAIGGNIAARGIYGSSISDMMVADNNYQKTWQEGVANANQAALVTAHAATVSEGAADEAQLQTDWTAYGIEGATPGGIVNAAGASVQTGQAAPAAPKTAAPATPPGPSGTARAQNTPARRENLIDRAAARHRVQRRPTPAGGSRPAGGGRGSQRSRPGQPKGRS